jgi:hypothetical protein
MHVARYASNVKIQRRRGVMGASADCHSFVVHHWVAGEMGCCPFLAACCCGAKGSGCEKVGRLQTARRRIGYEHSRTLQRRDECT